MQLNFRLFLLFANGSVIREKYGVRYDKYTCMFTYVQRLNVWPTATDWQVFDKR
jgi:hypothetical protein